MTESFAAAVRESQPPDTGVRVGEVVAINPLVVSVQGGRITNCGAIHSYTPVVGHTVILLRMDNSWCAIGVPRPASAA